MPTRIVLCYPVEANTSNKSPPPCRRPRSSTPARSGSPKSFSRPTSSADTPKCRSIGTASSRRGRLRWIQSSAAGMDHCLVPSVIESDIAVTSASGVLADQVAEHTIALVTAWCRSLPTFFRAQQKKEFIRRPTRDLTRSTVGIVGLGGVGRRLAQLLAPFEVRILATDMFPVDKPACVEAPLAGRSAGRPAGGGRFLVLCLPLNDSTRGIIDAAKLARMKPNGAAGERCPRAVGRRPTTWWRPSKPAISPAR